VKKMLPIVDEVEIYIDDELSTTVPYSGSGDFSFDLSTLSGYTGHHRVKARLMGDGTAVYTNETEGYITDNPVYGVSGLYQSASALTRTDDSIGMSYTKNSDGSIDSDFNSVFPWNQAELVEDENGNMFVQMPEMFFRVNADASHRLTDIAVSEMPGETGTWYRVAPFCYGRYTTNANGTTKLVSKSGIMSSSSGSRQNLRTYARNNGTGYQIDDLYHKTVMKFLWWIEWATKNTLSIMTGCTSGTGTTGGSLRVATGGTDNVRTPSGWESTRAQMRWHYIEDFIGGVSQYLDGVYMTGLSAAPYATADPSYFSDNTTGKAALCYKSPSTNYNIMAYGWDSDHPFLCLPCESSSSSAYTSYFRSRAYNYGTSYRAVMEGPYYAMNSTSSTGYAGFMLYNYSYSSASLYYGCRLVYHGTLT
jgi:hypothetical protein